MPPSPFSIPCRDNSMCPVLQCTILSLSLALQSFFSSPAINAAVDGNGKKIKGIFSSLLKPTKPTFNFYELGPSTFFMSEYVSKLMAAGVRG